MDLCRRILLVTESCSGTALTPNKLRLELVNEFHVEIGPLEESPIDYHINLLISQEMLRIVEIFEGFPKFGRTNGLELTWEGHEFLDNARDEKRWGKAKKISEQAGGVALDVMKGLLQKLASQALGLPG